MEENFLEGEKKVLGVLTSVWLEPYQRKRDRGAKRQRGRENKQECWEMGRRIKRSLSLRSLHAFGGGYGGEASDRGCGVGVCGGSG